MDGDCRLAAASWRLLARHSLFMEGTGQAGGLQKAPGQCQEGPGWLHEGSAMASRGHRESSGEQWEDPGMVPGGAEEAMSDLSLRFLLFGDYRTL